MKVQVQYLHREDPGKQRFFDFKKPITQQKKIKHKKDSILIPGYNKLCQMKIKDYQVILQHVIHGLAKKINSLQLKTNSQFKLGKKLFKVVQFHNNTQYTQYQFQFQKSSIASISDKCRICLSNSNDPQNPILYGLCCCAGTINYIHYFCLRKWIQTRQCRIRVPRQNIYQFDGQSLKCQLCNQYFPIFINNPFNNQILPIPNIAQQDISQNYLVLQTIMPNSKKKLLVIVFKQKDQYTIGRGDKNDLNFADGTISRTHWYFLYDLQSRYGTLQPLIARQVLCEGQYELVYENLLISLKVQRQRCYCYY